MKLALYTTVYPGVAKYLAAWYDSVLRQTDADFDLWIALDGVDAETASRQMGGGVTAVWVQAAPGDTIARVRQRAWEKLADRCDAVVLVDSDDLLLPTRVATARQMLGSCDLAGCPLELVDAAGGSLGLIFERPREAPDKVLPRTNVFGLSNSAYRSELLRRCLPLPAAAELVDWYLATRAWLLGASMAFGDTVEMKYRQHSANMVRVAPPFDAGQIGRDTERVLHHLRLVLTHGLEGAQPGRSAELRDAAADVEAFYERVVHEPAALEQYTAAINRLDLSPLWWSSVAHRSLRHMWAPPKEKT